MSARTIGLLICKDFALLRGPLVLYAAGGLIALLLVGASGTRGLGLTLALNMLIGAGFHILLASVHGERERRTQIFVLSLPVRPGDQALAKVLFSLAAYLVPATSCAWVFVRLLLANVPAGSVSPWHVTGLAALCALGWVSGFGALIAIAVLTESVAWTLTVGCGVLFVGGNGALQHPGVRRVLESFTGSLLRDPATLFGSLAIELGFLLLVCVTTVLLTARRRSYL